MKLKRILSLVLALMLIFTMVACKNATDNDTPNEDVSDKDTPDENTPVQTVATTAEWKVNIGSEEEPELIEVKFSQDVSVNLPTDLETDEIFVYGKG